MGKYNVTHTCGHEQTHQLVGKIADRDRKIAWLETTTCGECHKTQQTRLHAAASAEAAEANATAGLAALTGSDKQIAWAETLRQPVIANLKEAANKLVAATDPHGKFSAAARQEITDAIDLVVNEIANQTASQYWIDHRSSLPATPAQATQHIWTQITKRNLAPTMFAEVKTLTGKGV